MNEQLVSPKEITQVFLIAAVQCQVHGWTLYGAYNIRKTPINVPDRNGLEVYVESVNHKYWVYLGANEYSLTPVMPELKRRPKKWFVERIDKSIYCKWPDGISGPVEVLNHDHALYHYSCQNNAGYLFGDLIPS